MQKSCFQLAAWLCMITLISCGQSPEDSQKEGPSNPRDPEAWLQLARDRQNIGAYEEAIGYLQKALELDPKFVPAHYQMGSVYEEWDKKKEAKKAYQKALELDHSNELARMGLASVYSKMKKNELAIEEYKKIASTHPDDPKIHFKIALEYWYIQEIPETAKHYLKAIEIDPNYLQAYLNLASVYERMKKWEEAIREIAIARQLAKRQNNEQALHIAESKLEFIRGRINLTKEEMDRKTKPPFE